MSKGEDRPGRQASARKGARVIGRPLAARVLHTVVGSWEQREKQVSSAEASNKKPS
jgi:hypothetical protein